jgi:hypothetical protein
MCEGMTSSSAVDEVWEDWKRTVNMTAREIEKFLGTEKSRMVAERSFGAAWTAEEAAGTVITLLRSPKADLTPDDAEAMRTVVGFVRRHLADRPRGDVRETRWRYLLMNWGHDPLKS